MREPDFLYVGAGKAGSSWMFEILREHPDVFVPGIKDIMFFDRYYDRGMAWYLDHFRGAADEMAVGELSHDYFLSERYARRIREQLPGVKILFCLREGVERTFSEYLYDRTLFQFASYREYKCGLSFEEFAVRPEVVNRGDYFNNMKPFYDLFPRERIMVFFYDDLKAFPREFARRLYSFLGVDPDFEPESLLRRVNTGREARSAFFAGLAYRGGQWLRTMGGSRVVGGIKRRGWFEKLLYKPFKSETEKPGMPVESAARLRDIYHRDYEKLARLIGMPLPAGWSGVGEK